MNNNDEMNHPNFLSGNFIQSIGNESAAGLSYIRENQPLNLRNNITSPPTPDQRSMQEQRYLLSPVNRQRTTNTLMSRSAINFHVPVDNVQQLFLSDTMLPLNLHQAITNSDSDATALINRVQQDAKLQTQQYFGKTQTISPSSDRRQTYPHSNGSLHHILAPGYDSIESFSSHTDVRYAFSPQTDVGNPYLQPNNDRHVYSTQPVTQQAPSPEPIIRHVFSPHADRSQFLYPQSNDVQNCVSKPDYRTVFSSQIETRQVFSPQGGNPQLLSPKCDNRNAFSPQLDNGHEFSHKSNTTKRNVLSRASESNGMRVFSPKADGCEVFSSQSNNSEVFSPSSDKRHQLPQKSETIIGHAFSRSSESNGMQVFSPKPDSFNVFSPQSDRQVFSSQNDVTNSFTQGAEGSNAFAMQLNVPPALPKNDADRQSFSSRCFAPDTLAQAAMMSGIQDAFTSNNFLPNTPGTIVNEVPCELRPMSASSDFHSEYSGQTVVNINTAVPPQPTLESGHQENKNIHIKKEERVMEFSADDVCSSPNDRCFSDNISSQHIERSQEVNNTKCADTCNFVQEHSTIKTLENEHEATIQILPISVSTSTSKQSNSIITVDVPKCSCLVCDSKFEKLDDLRAHMLFVHNVQSDAPKFSELQLTKELKVEKDEKIILSQDSMIEPLDVFSTGISSVYTKFSCVDCGAEFKNKDKLIAHVRKHTEQDTLLCTICGKSFFKTDKLARHMLVHSGERPYICRHCGATFTRSDKLRAHLLARHNDSSYSCRICRESFEDIVALKLHLARRRCIDYRPSENEEEERRRREREALESSFNEIAAQIGDPDIDIALMLNRDKLAATFDASISQAGELDANALKDSVLTGLDEELAPEPTKQMALVDETLILPDINTERVKKRAAHAKKLEKIFKRINKYRTVACPHCDIKLPGAYTLTRHLRISHNIIKMYQYKKKEKVAKGEGGEIVPRVRIKRPAILKHCQCQVCGKSFTKLDTLKRHEVTHTGERAFKCRYCDAKYSRSDRLRKHLRSSHIAAAYPCIKCDLVFETKQELRKHISIHRVKAEKPVVEKIRIRGPYKKRKLKLGTIGDSAAATRVQGNGQSGTFSTPSTFNYNSLKVEKTAESWPFATTSTVDALADATVRQLFADPTAFGTIDSSGLFKDGPTDEKCVNRQQDECNPNSTGNNSVTVENESTLNQSSQALPAARNDDKPTEIVFRLSSEQLSNALALRNHGKSTFNNNNKKSCNNNVNISTDSVFSEWDEVKSVTELESTGEVRVKRKYTKRTNRDASVNEDDTQTEKHRTHKCPLCPKLFSSPKAAEKHEISHQKVKPFECRHCGGRFTRYDNLQSHLRRIHNDRMYSCKQCAEIFESSELLKEHVPSHSISLPDASEHRCVDKVYICRHCKKIFSVREELQKHVLSHKVSSVKIEHDANVDEKNVLSKDPLYALYEDAAVSSCGNEEPSVCSVGKFKRGRKPKYLKIPFVAVPIKQEVDVPDVQIKQEKHDISSDEHDESFSPPARDEHLGFVSRDLPLVGDDSDHDDQSDVGRNGESDTMSLNSGEFKRKMSLLVTSSGESFVCSQCGKKLIGEQALRQHMKLVHTVKFRVKFKTNQMMVLKIGKKRRGLSHRCVQCGKTFKQIFMLRRHMKRHEKLASGLTHDCLQCFNTFESSDALNSHIVIDHGGSCSEVRTKRAYRRKTPLQKQLEFQKRTAKRRIREQNMTDSASVIERNSRGLYQCDICNISFSMAAKLRQHAAMHAGKESHSCKHCSQTFECSNKLRVHLKSVHNEQNHSCTLCDETFDTMTELHAHALKHKDIMDTNKLLSQSNGISNDPNNCRHLSDILTEKEYAVISDNESIKNGDENSQLVTDKDVKVEVESVDDEECSLLGTPVLNDNLVAPSTELNGSSGEVDMKMLMHLLTDTKPRGRFGGDKHLNCPICNKGMSSQHALKRHVTCAHTDDRPYVCCDCPKAFSRMDKFRNHLRRHYGFIYPCTVCGATYLRWFHWKKHMSTHILFCDLCEFTCVNQAAMNRHIAKHTGEKQFTCTYCSKQFWRNYHLQIHTRIHTGEMPYACDKCGKRFFRSDRLKRHLETHERDCGLLCSTCGKSFTTAIALKVHAHIHDAVTPQICFLCQAVLPNPKEMRKHRKMVHPGESFFVCTICNHHFQSHSELVTHSTEHFDGASPPERFLYSTEGKISLKPRSKQPYLCSMCGRQLSSRHALLRHQRVHTGERNFTCQYCAQQFTTSYGLRRHVEKHEKLGHLPLIKTEKMTDGDFAMIGLGVAEMLGVDNNRVGLNENEVSPLNSSLLPKRGRKSKSAEKNTQKRVRRSKKTMTIMQHPIESIVTDVKKEDQLGVLIKETNELLSVSPVDTRVLDRLASPVFEKVINEQRIRRVASIVDNTVSDLDNQINQAISVPDDYGELTRQWQTPTSINDSNVFQTFASSTNQAAVQPSISTFANKTTERVTIPSEMDRSTERLKVSTFKNGTPTLERSDSLYLHKTADRQESCGQGTVDYGNRLEDNSSTHSFVAEPSKVSTFNRTPTELSDSLYLRKTEVRREFSEQGTVDHGNHLNDSSSAHSFVAEPSKVSTFNRSPTLDRSDSLFLHKTIARQEFGEQGTVNYGNRRKDNSFTHSSVDQTDSMLQELVDERQNRLILNEQMMRKQFSPVFINRNKSSFVEHDRGKLTSPGFGEQTEARQSGPLFLNHFEHRSDRDAPFFKDNSRDIHGSSSFSGHFGNIQTAHSFGDRTKGEQITLAHANQIRDWRSTMLFDGPSMENPGSSYFANPISNGSESNLVFRDFKRNKESPAYRTVSVDHEDQGRNRQTPAIENNRIWERQGADGTSEADKKERLPLDLAAIARSVGINIPEGYS